MLTMAVPDKTTARKQHNRLSRQHMLVVLCRYSMFDTVRNQHYSKFSNT